jgi:hypothetical protein
MTSSKPATAIATDWTRLLADPDLARNLGRLLQVYREAAPEQRERALLAAMRDIKKKSSAPNDPDRMSQPQLITKPAEAIPPFEPDIFTPTWGHDRRRHPRIKCFVAVEMRVNEATMPIWGNLSNTSLGGCQVETAAQVEGGSRVEIGLWISSGKIWVKGIALNGVVIRSAPARGIRIRFEGLNPSEKENLKRFLKYVQETTRETKSEKSYLQLLK